MSLVERLKRAPATAAPPAAPAPPRSAEREALALALAARADAQRVADAAVSAATLAAEQARDARSNLRKVEAEIAEARGGSDRSELLQIQQQQMAALCGVEDTKAEHERLDAATDRPLASLRRAEAAVLAAVNAIVAAEAGRLLAEIGELRDRLAGRLAALGVVHGAVEPGRALAEILSVIARSKCDDLAELARRHPAAADWRAARAALATDADARLPD